MLHIKTLRKKALLGQTIKQPPFDSLYHVKPPSDSTLYSNLIPEQSYHIFYSTSIFHSSHLTEYRRIYKEKDNLIKEQRIKNVV